MASATRRRAGGMDYWPGFVDALSTLLLAIIFVLSIFVMGQFLLSQEIAGRDTALQRLNRQILELNDLLALERSGRKSLEDSLALANATLGALEIDKRKLEGALSSGGAAAAAATAAQSALANERQVAARALAQIETLNQQMAALRRQLAALEEALNASELKDKDSQTRIADLGQRLNVALAQRVQELTRYRSEFFGRMREIIGARPDIRVVGDRFVFQSELFFDAGSAQLKSTGLGELDKLAATVNDLARRLRPTSTGFCASTAILTRGRCRAQDNSGATGISRSRARCRSCSISSAKACSRHGSRRQASANSSRSNLATATRLTAATAASSSSSPKGEGWEARRLPFEIAVRRDPARFEHLTLNV